MPSQKEVSQLFNYYDSDKSGALDYKEFTSIICGTEEADSAVKKST